jgi:hypothetical protein
MFESIKHAINVISDPKYSFFLVVILFYFAIKKVRVWTKPRFSVILAGLFVLFFVISCFDSNFLAIVALPDNIPIVGLLVLVFYFTWWSLYRGVVNDMRVEQGKDLWENEDRGGEKVFTWPHLVFPEFIATILGSVVLIVWAILVKAPLEDPANPAVTPNPSKAPWYFLGLQEMLVYFDPWLAGVVLPTLILVGLIAIPYIDTNPKGNGYWTFKERKFAITSYLFGFIALWVYLIVVGTFLRGPGWNIFGPYEKWDTHKVVPLLNVNFSEIMYVKLFNTGLPEFWLTREIFGILLVVAYFVVPMALLRKVPNFSIPKVGSIRIGEFFQGLYVKTGAIRYYITVFLVLAMASLPIKMLLRWFFNLKYVVSIPEFFFNI